MRRAEFGTQLWRVPLWGLLDEKMQVSVATWDEAMCQSERPNDSGQHAGKRSAFLQSRAEDMREFLTGFYHRAYALRHVIILRG